MYIPSSITRKGMDLNDPSPSQWCYSRSMETHNIAVFWEAGRKRRPMLVLSSNHYMSSSSISCRNQLV
ncbi:MAG: hypothetical protein ACLFSB_06710 [Chitinispirillaceae bacterium]